MCYPDETTIQCRIAVIPAQAGIQWINLPYEFLPPASQEWQWLGFKSMRLPRFKTSKQYWWTTSLSLNRKFWS